MTTIAVSKKHKEIACDLQFSHASGIKFKGSSKCMRLSKNVAKTVFGVDSAVVGACGNADHMAKAWAFLSDPTMFNNKVPKIKATEFVALVEGNEIYTSVDLQTWLAVDQQYYSVGSGSHLAIGAMESGSSPLQAVKHAAKHDYMTGMGFKTYKL